MVKYDCFSCDKEISPQLMGRRVRCPYCGSKVLHKKRNVTTKVKAI